MQNANKTCCRTTGDKKTGALRGVAYGLIPHTFCLLFIIFSALGAVGATTLTKKVLLIPYIFPTLLAISLLFASVTAVVYLKKNDCLCLSGVKKRWKYLLTLYTATIATNIVIIFLLFPAITNINSASPGIQFSQSAIATIKVAIPCSGHAPLIIDELSKTNGINAVNFKMPNIFKISYDPQKISTAQINDLEIFKTFKINRDS